MTVNCLLYCCIDKESNIVTSKGQVFAWVLDIVTLLNTADIFVLLYTYGWFSVTVCVLSVHWILWMLKCQWAVWVGVTGHLLNDLFQVDPIRNKKLCFTSYIFVFCFHCVWKGGIEFCCTTLHCMYIGGQTLVMSGAVWPPHFVLYNQYSFIVDTSYKPLCLRVQERLNFCGKFW